MERGKLRFYLPNTMPAESFSNKVKNNKPGIYFGTFTKKEVISFLPNGSTVYSLPLDNMPCLVPDMRQFNMPNAAGRIDYNPIPNAGKDIQLLPKSHRAAPQFEK